MASEESGKSFTAGEGNLLRKTPGFTIALPVAAFYLYLAGSAPFLGQWDSYDYLQKIVCHQPSALGIGRPVFVGYNILLWESMRRIFRLEPLQVETVAMGGMVLMGVLGVILFQRLSSQLLRSPAAQMAALAFAISPLYAAYSGYVMTEVPMLAALLASALILWKSGVRHPLLRDVLGGIFFGLAVGIREQALTLGGAFIWILWSRRGKGSSRLRSIAVFGASAAAIILTPVLLFYLQDQAGFLARTRTWLHALPTARTQFWNNVQAGSVYTLAMCPGAWLAAAGAGLYCLLNIRTARGRKAEGSRAVPRRPDSMPNAVLGLITCLILPMAILWFDADVQMHPRYTLVFLPASLIICALLFSRWIPSKRGPVIWAVIQVLVFGAALAALSPYRQSQIRKMEFARVMRDSIPGEGLLIAGNLSPILDYYRGIGVRPAWRILWSGWNWDAQAAKKAIRRAWEDGIPVYLSTNPSGWSYCETEFLDVHFLLQDSRKEQFAPMLLRVYPPAENHYVNKSASPESAANTAYGRKRSG